MRLWKCGFLDFQAIGCYYLQPVKHMLTQLQNATSSWPSIITALATAILAILTWRTVRAMAQQITAPKRDKHLEWLHGNLLVPLKIYLEGFFAQLDSQGLLPIEETHSQDNMLPRELLPYEQLPLLKSELVAHFKQLDNALSTFVSNYRTFTDIVMESIKRDYVATIADKMTGKPPERVIPYYYRSVFASMTHARPHSLLCSDGAWHLKAEADPFVLDVEVGTKDAADELGAALWRAISVSRTVLADNFRDIYSEWHKLVAVLDRALAEVQLKGKCEICPFA